MGALSQTTSLTSVYTTVYSGVDQRKHQSPESLAFVRDIHRWSVNSPQKGPVTRKFFPFDNVIMNAGTVISDHPPNKVWDEIIYPFPNDATVEAW